MKLKEFLLLLEEDDGLRDTYRAANRGRRKRIATDMGVSGEDAEALVSNDPEQIRSKLEPEPGTAFIFVVM